MNRQPNTVELRRLQIGARAALVAGIVASVAANVAAAEPTLIGRVVAGWSPAALFITVELITRLPARTGPLALARLAATGGVAGIAAWISYHHIVEVALRAGESPTSARTPPPQCRRNDARRLTHPRRGRPGPRPARAASRTRSRRPGHEQPHRP